MSISGIKKSRASIKRNSSLKTSASLLDPHFRRGSSTFNYPNGDQYVGEYCAHLSGVVWKEGYGTYRTKDGQSYEGVWYDDKLVEGKPVKITYADGSTYEGALEKYKYKGGSSFTFPGNLKVVAEFVENKPIGDVILVDNVGKLWYGHAESEQSVLLPENIYYENIPKERGKGLHRKKQQKEDSLEDSLKSETSEKFIDMNALENRVFKKSEKLKENYDFEDSDWYKNYINFKKKQLIIMRKIKKGLPISELTDDEVKWYVSYEKFKEKYNKFFSKKKIKPNDSLDLSMLHTFYSEAYQASKPDFVMYPTEKED